MLKPKRRSVRVPKNVNVPVAKPDKLSAPRKRLRGGIPDHVQQFFEREAVSDHEDDPEINPEDDDVSTGTLEFDEDSIERTVKLLESDADGELATTPVVVPPKTDADAVATLASQLSAEERAKLVELLVGSTNSSVVDLTHPSAAPAAIPLPTDATPLSNYREIQVPGWSNLCAFFAFKLAMSQVFGATHLTDAGDVRAMFFRMLPSFFGVPVVGEMAYNDWAAAHSRSAEDMMQFEMASPGLSNFCVAALAFMNNLESVIFNLCVDHPDYIVPIQRSNRPGHCVGNMRLLYRGNSNSVKTEFGDPPVLGHYNPIFDPTDDLSFVEPALESMKPPGSASSTVVPRRHSGSATPATTPTKQTLVTSATTSPSTRRAVVLAGPATSPQRTLGFKYAQVMYAGMSLSHTAAQMLQAKVTTMPLHVQVNPNKLVTDNKITFSVSHSAAPDGRYKNAFGLIGHFLLSFGNRHSSAVPGMQLSKYNFFQAKLNFYLQTLSETAPLYNQIDAAAATYLFNLEVDSARHPKIAALLRNLKINSGNDVSAFKDALLGLEGAHAIVEDDVLLLSHQLIGPSNPGAVRISDELANLNPAIAYAKTNGRHFSMSQGYSLHPDGTLTEHTVDNTRAYTEIDAQLENIA